MGQKSGLKQKFCEGFWRFEYAELKNLYRTYLASLEAHKKYFTVFVNILYR